MEQPLGFVTQGSDLVCKVHQFLYGIKQSPQAWFRKFSRIVQIFRLKCSEAPHSIFSCHISPSKCAL